MSSPPDGGAWRRARRAGGGAFLLYLAVSVLLFGRHAITDLDGVCACEGSGDSTSFMWALVWWPYAIASGENPFHADVIWVPGGVNLTQAPSIPGASVLAAPITFTAGPIAAYNVVALLAPAVAAWCAYRLCRYLTGAQGPSLVGGYVYGFGTYTIAHALGHLHLVLIFLAPAAVHLVLLRLDERIGSRRFIIIMAAVFAAQILLLPELLWTGLCAGAVAMLLGYATGSPERRRQIRPLAPALLAAGGLAAVVVSPFLYWGVKGLGEANSEGWRQFTDLYPADALNVLTPTPVTELGHQWFTDITSKYDVGSYAESSTYLGPIVLAIVLAYAVARRREAGARVLIGTILVVFVASLGPELQVAGKATGVPLPWTLVDDLPGFDHVLPVRLSVLIFLAVAVVVALWLADSRVGGRLKVLAAALAIATLLPSLGAHYWRGRPYNPGFFTSALHKRLLKKDETVLIFPYGRRGNSMLWQAEARMRFRMPEGYISVEYPAPYLRDPFFSTLLSDRVDRRAAARLRDFIVRRDVTSVIVDATRSSPWAEVLAALRLKPVPVGGVLLYRVPASWAA